ncbi:hypothetical protein FRC10_010635 [Ceratobasidium sp. 414]|nr:hypothetical protein FRC10_010635 [Ceratobasidium sp. 414]
MSAVNNLGGFVAPAANERHEAPTSSSLAPSSMPLIDLTEDSAHHPTPSPFSMGPTPGHASTSAQPNFLDVDYPGNAPPPYDLVASTPSTTTPRSPPEKGGASFSTGASSPSPQSPQPQQYPMAFGVPGSSQQSEFARSPSSSKKAEPVQPAEYSVASTSTTLVHAGPGAVQPNIAGQAAARPVSSRNPLDPPPPCFSRVVLPPSGVVTYEPLPKPYVIHGKTGKMFLDDAFAITPPPAFHKHDVETDDWMRFLEDLQTVARLNGSQKVVASALPVTRHLGFIGHFVSKAVEQSMRKQNTASVVDLLSVWNERFFNHRRELYTQAVIICVLKDVLTGLSVILCKGDYRESGIDRDLPAPDRPHAQARSKGHGDDSSSSSSSDSDDRSHGRREMRRQRREERRAGKRAHREERRDGRGARREKKAKSRGSYRLVVVSTN